MFGLEFHCPIETELFILEIVIWVMIWLESYRFYRNRRVDAVQALLLC
jgi:hypothetical protein